MARPNRHGTKPLPKRTKAILDASAERVKIRMLLANGAIVTPIGPRTILRLPGSQMAQEFPPDLVEAVQSAISGRTEVPPEDFKENSDAG